MLKKEHRLKSGSRIQQVRAARPSWANRRLVLARLGGEQAASRFAFVVSRRIGNAVTRNRVKRLLRAVVWQHLPEIEGRWDVVLIARRSIRGATFMQVDRAVVDLFKQSGLL